LVLFAVLVGTGVLVVGSLVLLVVQLMMSATPKQPMAILWPALVDDIEATVVV
jgi:hypothetical protein